MRAYHFEQVQDRLALAYETLRLLRLLYPGDFPFSERIRAPIIIEIRRLSRIMGSVIWC